MAVLNVLAATRHVKEDQPTIQQTCKKQIAYTFTSKHAKEMLNDTS